ncbi:MAG: histidinol phosphatase, partial [bacterium]
MKRRLLIIAAAAILACVPAAARAYNLYIGDLHTHSGFSDGTGLPENAYDTARNTGHFDFLAVTDHVEALGLRDDLPAGAPK